MTATAGDDATLSTANEVRATFDLDRVFPGDVDLVVDLGLPETDW